MATAKVITIIGRDRPKRRAVRSGCMACTRLPPRSAIRPAGSGISC
jgi:hypothetical protein